MSLAKANLLLVLVTVAWGSSYIFTKSAVNELTPFTLIAYRFLLAFFAMVIILWKQLYKTNWRVVVASSIQGFLMGIVCIMFAYVMSVMDASVAAFIMSTTVILVPIIMVFITWKLPTRQVVIGGTITMIGLALFSLEGEVKMSAGMLICLATAFLYAVHIICNNYFSQRMDSLQLGVFQLFFAGFFSLVGALMVETPRIPSSSKGWGALIALALFCSAFALIGQSVAQQYTTAVSTGFIFALEPIFAAILAFMLLGERMNAQEIIGACFILVGVLAANHIPKRFKKNTVEEVSSKSNELIMETVLRQRLTNTKNQKIS